MKMPDTITFNAIKSQAKLCAQAIRDEVKSRDKSVKKAEAYEAAVAKHLPFFYQKVELKCTKIFFSWTIGHINGRWGQEGADDEREWG